MIQICFICPLQGYIPGGLADNSWQALVVEPALARGSRSRWIARLPVNANQLINITNDYTNRHFKPLIAIPIKNKKSAVYIFKNLPFPYQVMCQCKKLLVIDCCKIKKIELLSNFSFFMTSISHVPSIAILFHSDCSLIVFTVHRIWRWQTQIFQTNVYTVWKITTKNRNMVVKLQNIFLTLDTFSISKLTYFLTIRSGSIWIFTFSISKLRL